MVALRIAAPMIALPVGGTAGASRRGQRAASRAGAALPRLQLRAQAGAGAGAGSGGGGGGGMPAFHLAFPVKDIAASRKFYGATLGCPEGRSSARWVDFNFYGHQIVCHLVDDYSAAASHNAVDGDPVPVPHFGLAMGIDEFHALARRVEEAGIKFEIKPHLRFEGMPGEQWTMFFKDPSGNALEFKAMSEPANLFAKYVVE